jgi:hypothetical protein
VRKHHIEDTHVGAKSLKSGHYFGAISDPMYFKLAALEAFLDDFSQKGLVFYI